MNWVYVCVCVCVCVCIVYHFVAVIVNGLLIVSKIPLLFSYVHVVNTQIQFLHFIVSLLPLEY